MNRFSRLMLAAAGLCVTAVAWCDTPAWITASNAQAVALLDVIVKYAPESAAAIGVEGHDGEVRDLKPDNVRRQEADLDAVAARLSAALNSETDARVTRVEEMLRGVPGLDVTRLPDGNYRLRIRGQRSIRGNPTDDNPLVVIDGISIPNESMGSMLADLSPGDVARIEVLKDASAMSMYGSRGANGVIVITTRRGRGERSP